MFDLDFRVSNSSQTTSHRKFWFLLMIVSFLAMGLVSSPEILGAVNPKSYLFKF